MCNTGGIMIEYIPFKNGNSICYKCVSKKKNGEILSERIVDCPMYIKNKEDFTYIIPCDDKGHVIHSAYCFLNKEMSMAAFNTRLQTAKGIRLAYCWKELAIADFAHLSASQTTELIRFMQGISLNDENAEIHVFRSNNTVNNYLSAIRAYFRFIGIEEGPLFDTKNVTVSLNSTEGITSTTEHKSYISNLRTASKERITPKYISPNEFSRLFKIVSSHNDETAKMLIHLMYAYGLRLGECLGLTIEDIAEVKRNNKMTPVLYIRNRKTDNKRFQSAKGKTTIIDKRQYKTSEYRKETDVMVITYDFYEQLVNYINITHEEMQNKYPKNYASGMADVVSNKELEGINHYVFMNRYGKVLSDQTWNIKLRKYFEKADIPVDYQNREFNLSHRFRHGFAMFHAKYSPKKLDALEKMMRHKSISSTLVYYNPTPEDEAAIKEEAQSYLYEQIPELKGDNNGK